MNYKQLNEYERAFINAYLQIGKSIRWIAKQIKRSPSTISREIKRNGIDKENGIIAHQKSLLRRKCAKKINIHKYRRFLRFLYDNFDKRYYSITVLIAMARRNSLFTNIPSHQSIYNWINLGLLNIKKIHLLRSSNKYKRKRKAVYSKNSKKHRIPIHMRPKHINIRKEVGHWEGDSVTMSKSGSKVITLVERKTRFAITIKASSHNMNENYLLIKKRIINSKHIFKSITFDNGMEFNKMYKLKKELGIKIYYCHPYAPCERGTNEVWNGFLRRFFPKGTDWRKVENDEIQRVTNLINKTPRKILNWKSSLEVISI